MLQLSCSEGFSSSFLPSRPADLRGRVLPARDERGERGRHGQRGRDPPRRSVVDHAEADGGARDFRPRRELGLLGVEARLVRLVGGVVLPELGDVVERRLGAVDLEREGSSRPRRPASRSRPGTGARRLGRPDRACTGPLAAWPSARWISLHVVPVHAALAAGARRAARRDRARARHGPAAGRGAARGAPAPAARRRGAA